MAKMLLDKAGIKYIPIDAEENKEMTLSYNIRKAPTMLVPKDDNYEVLDNVSLIKKFVEEYGK